MVSFVGASGRTPMIGRAPLAPTCKARIIIKRVGAVREPPLVVRYNDEVEAQRRRWTFYETIIIVIPAKAGIQAEILDSGSSPE